MPASARKVEHIGGDGPADLPLRAAADGLERPRGAGHDRRHVGRVARDEPRALDAGAHRLEPRQVREALRARVHVLAPLLGAAAQRRIDLAGIEAHVGIERVLHAMLDLEVRRVELIRHEIALLDADAVLARQHAADVDAELQDLEAERFGSFDLAGDIGVVEDQRMQVTVAGVKNIRDAQPVALLHLDIARSTRGSSRRGIVPSMQ